ncbi:hypothetical protein GGI17_001887 [Coemansia sp. S146]|nr:hypothetical protein GGI17_001887 [Coemansia sp. S146]
MVLAAIGDDPLEKVRVGDLTEKHKLALGPIYPLDDFYQDDVTQEDYDEAMNWQIDFGGKTRSLRTKKDWDWALALARVIGLLNTDGYISEEQKRRSGSSNFNVSSACVGSMYDVRRFQDDVLTVSGKEVGFSCQQRDNTLVYIVVLPVCLATDIANMAGQVTGKRSAKIPLHPEFVLKCCPRPILRAYLSGCMSGDGCVSYLRNDPRRQGTIKHTRTNTTQATPIRPRKTRVTKASVEQAVMVKYCSQNGYTLGQGSAQRRQTMASGITSRRPSKTNTADDDHRGFHWSKVFVQCTTFEHAAAMTAKLQAMVKMFEKCGITGLVVRSDAHNGQIYRNGAIVSNTFWLVQTKPLKNVTQWSRISFPYCCPKQARTDVYVSQGRHWEEVEAQQQRIARIASYRLDMELRIKTTTASDALASAHTHYKKNYRAINKEHCHISLHEFKKYRKAKGKYSFHRHSFGGVSPMLRDQRARDFFNDGGRRPDGITYRKTVYATTQLGTAVPLYLTNIVSITERGHDVECTEFSNMPDSRGLQCDGVIVWANSDY